ncbi:helix-turn-helix domain-containing protein [Streptomyces aidingensis]|uniref:Helix-turn-helix domain-containing protein n=1 Tax=Streptomyces aidingensis TaxID=910347 RepID=A0A1I1FQL4_9ACTN|nr:helix-turn-helix transcriptional regulator [Streptomyces aidingensis]SFC01624.1 Helix-turn-helix domain-containing protein [Streptomyces aidingensis]
MPPRQFPTARQLRLGQELKKLRERAGLTAREAGEMIGANQARISNIETGRFGVSAERIRTLAANYGCHDETLIEALIGMTGRQERGWWEKYRGLLPDAMLDLAETEHFARDVQAASVLHIPGVLQTEAHARALFREAVPPLEDADVETRVSFRAMRRQILQHPDPVPFRAVVHEAALRMRFGGLRTSRDQLMHLVEMSERPAVELLVIPFAGGVFAGSGQSVNYFAGPIPQLDTAQLDQSHGPLLVDSADQLAKYRLILDKMKAAALGPQESRDFVYAIAKELEREQT